MRAITVVPGQAGWSLLDDQPEPGPEQGAVQVRGRLLGLCGTDREIIAGAYGEAPPGEQRLVVGHESLGEVVAAPAGSGLSPGDLVVGIVRRLDPVPCPACAAGEWDMCRNGLFTERGIVRAHGYGSEQWRVEPEYAVPVPGSLGDLAVLLEPTSVVAKAWEQVDRIAGRAFFPQAGRARALVTGAGPIGLLACLLGVQRGYEVTVVDIVEGGPKRDLVEALGARYHVGQAEDIGVEVDVVVECTGLGAVGRSAGSRLAGGGVMCLTGIANLPDLLDIDSSALNRRMVLNNRVLFGSVNAGRRHWEQAVEALGRADPVWLAAMLTRRLPLDGLAEALERRDDDIKVVLDLQA